MDLQCFWTEKKTRSCLKGAAHPGFKSQNSISKSNKKFESLVTRGSFSEHFVKVIFFFSQFRGSSLASCCEKTVVAVAVR